MLNDAAWSRRCVIQGAQVQRDATSIRITASNTKRRISRSHSPCAEGECLVLGLMAPSAEVQEPDTRPAIRLLTGG